MLMSFVFGCFVVRDLSKSGCGQNYYLTPPYFVFVPTHNSQCAPKAGFGAVSSLLLDIGHLEKRFIIMQRASCKALRWDKVISSLHRPVSYYILVSFG